MNTNLNTFFVTDLRHRTTEVLRVTKEKGATFLLRHSRTEVALVDVEYLRVLQEAYEDYLDILEFDQTVNLKRLSLAEHKKKTKK